MNNQTDTQDTYPPLPYPSGYFASGNGEDMPRFSEDQMRAYVDADRTLRADTSPSLSDEDIAKSIGLSFGGREHDFKRFAEAVRRTLRAGQSEPVAEWRVGQKVRIEGEVGEIRRIDLEKQWAWVSWPDPLFANQYLSGWRSFSSFAAIGGAGQSPTASPLKYSLGHYFEHIALLDQSGRSVAQFRHRDESTRKKDAEDLLAALRSTLPEATGGKGS